MTGQPPGDVDFSELIQLLLRKLIAARPLCKCHGLLMEIDTERMNDFRAEPFVQNTYEMYVYWKCSQI